MEIGDKVKELRERAGLTQEELAELMGVQRNTVWRWENKKAGLRGENIQRISTVLNVNASELMSPDEPDIPVREKTKGESKRGELPGLAYWGGVADNAKTVAQRGNSEDIADVTHILMRALASLGAKVNYTPQVAALGREVSNPVAMA